MYKSKFQQCPSIFNDLYEIKPNIKYTLRTTGLIEPLCKTKQEQFKITYRAPHIWNKILAKYSNLQGVNNINCFQKLIKKSISKYKNLINDFF
jgi:hypothetical protein